MGIVWVLELTPERINKDLSGFFEKRESLQDMSRVARGKKKQNKIVKELSRIRRILTETGKEKNFSVALTLSLILMVVGCVIAILFLYGRKQISLQSEILPRDARGIG